MKKRVLAVLLAVALAAGALPSAYAADDARGISISAQYADGTIEVAVALADVEGVTNGRLRVGYNDAILTLESAEAADRSIVSSVNANTRGEVYFAWVGSSLTSEKTDMLYLTFSALPFSGMTILSAESLELYAGGTAVELTEDEAKVSVAVEGAAAPPAAEPTAQPTEEPGDDDFPFVDVPDHWAEEEIKKIYDAGLVNGTSDETYSPDDALDRAMFAAILYRAAGSPAVAGENPFADLASGEYYVDAVAWACGAGVVNGTSDTTYSPYEVITREQLVAMMFRYAQSLGRDTSARADLGSFADASSVSDYALDAMRWAVAEGIIEGDEAGLRPAYGATRAQMAAILCRFLGL